MGDSVNCNPLSSKVIQSCIGKDIPLLSTGLLSYK